MARSDREILEQFINKLVPEIKKVSKRFAPTIEGVVTDKTGTIFASPYINTLIDGRKPTSSNARKGSPTLQEILLGWIKERGIAPRPKPSGKVPTLEQLSWAMAVSMHKYGDLLYQRGGGNDIFAPIITEDRIKSLLTLFSDKYYNEVFNINLPEA